MGHEHKYMGHETANWGGRGLGYMLFNAQTSLYAEDRGLQSTDDPGA
jgi:hypothetical protein